MQTSESPMQNDPAFNYHLLRMALELFKRKPSMLEHRQHQQALSKAQRSYELESLVLDSPEAQGLVIPKEQLQAALLEVKSRYTDDEEFEQDLASNGLDANALSESLRRELIFDAVMQRVSAKAADVSDLDMRLFFELHRDRFTSPEVRSARHILITVNPEYMENTQPVAMDRARKLADKLAASPNRFADLAKRNSECPTAMEGGKLGEVQRGQLYESLDETLFAMQEGEVSEVVESELGFHVLLCEKIKPAKAAPYRKAAPRIRELLEQRGKRNCQKAYLSALTQVHNA